MRGQPAPHAHLSGSRWYAPTNAATCHAIDTVPSEWGILPKGPHGESPGRVRGLAALKIITRLNWHRKTGHMSTSAEDVRRAGVPGIYSGRTIPYSAERTL